jgi:hypothetical protein
LFVFFISHSRRFIVSVEAAISSLEVIESSPNMFLCNLPPSLRTASVLVLFSCSSNAQGASSCASTEHTAGNATGTIQIPGFQPFIDTPSVQNSTWTISTGIKEIQDLNSNSYVLEQSFWLDAQPLIDTSAADLPYTGCAVLLTGFSNPKRSIGTNSSNSCDGVFDTACYNAIMDTVNTFILEDSPGSIENVCQTMSILKTAPSACKKYAWTSTTSTRKITHAFP